MDIQKKKISHRTYKALTALVKGSYHQGISAKAVAVSLWGDDPAYEYLFLASSNQGNGACCGKKAWLCAGAFMCRLMKQGFVKYDKNFRGYYLTPAGREVLSEYKSQNKIQS